MVCLFLQCVLAEVLPILQRAIRLNVVSQQICAVPIIDVESFVIGAKSDAVRPPDVGSDADNLVAVWSDVINGSGQVIRRWRCAYFVTIGEVDATLFVDIQIVVADVAYAMEAVGYDFLASV